MSLIKLLIACVSIGVCFGVSVSVGALVDNGTVFAEVLVLSLTLAMVLVMLLILVLVQTCGVGDSIYVRVGIYCSHMVSHFNLLMAQLQVLALVLVLVLVPVLML